MGKKKKNEQGEIPELEAAENSFSSPSTSFIDVAAHDINSHVRASSPEASRTAITGCGFQQLLCYLQMK